MNEWSEKIDSALEIRDRQIAELREPITGLEKRFDAGTNSSS
jgi:hypothetical protein